MGSDLGTVVQEKIHIDRNVMGIGTTKSYQKFIGKSTHPGKIICGIFCRLCTIDEGGQTAQKRRGPCACACFGRDATRYNLPGEGKARNGRLLQA